MRASVGWAVSVLAGLLTVYATVVPTDFNRVEGNRRFFDSDGEFILRQFSRSKTFTHNDHLLYHVLGSGLHAGLVPSSRARDGALAHKTLSAVAGAVGVVILFAAGVPIMRDRIGALLLALGVGGTAGWLFFSSTIDTYMPSLAVSCGALAMALAYMRSPRTWRAAALGGLMGLAFLFRTDAFLLAPLGLVLTVPRKSSWRAWCAALAAGLLVGGAGYAVLARGCYGVKWADVPAWALGSQERPEARRERVWGVASNLERRQVELTSVNQTFYTVLLPGLEQTRIRNLHRAYAGSAIWALAVYGAGVFGAAAYGAWRRRREDERWTADRSILLAIGISWFLGRTLFYVWWDPHDPFLFAVMSLPALWMLLAFGWRPAQGAGRTELWLIRSVLAVLTIAIWAHNTLTMVLPLRALPGP